MLKQLRIENERLRSDVQAARAAETAAREAEASARKELKDGDGDPGMDVSLTRDLSPRP